MKNTEKISKSLRTRYVKYGGYAAIITIALIAGLIGFNLVCQIIAPQFDLTQNKLFSISEQSIQVAGSLASPVTIYCMWESGKETPQVREIVDLYAAETKNIRRQDIDPDRNPGFILKYDRDKKGIEKGSIIVEGENDFRVIRLQDMYEVSYANPQNPQITGLSIEKRITSALLYVSSGVTPVVYEITGHKEKLLEELGMQEMLERENYSLAQINLLQSDIPEDASALILNGPAADFTKTEADKLLAWLEKGGRLLTLMDIQTGPSPNLDGVFASFGIRFEFGIVFELNKDYMMANNILYTVPDMNRHEIMNPLLEKRSPVILPFGRGVAALDLRRQTTRLVPLLVTSQLSFLRTDLTQNTVDFIEESDIQGPVTLAMAVSERAGADETRIAAIGCGTFLEALNIFGQIPGNIDMFMNSLTWLQDRPENLSVRTKSLITAPMYLTESYVIIFGLLFVIVIPLALFAAGFVTWLRRRHL
ncbi:MAG: GldG family protein [Spirochaetaceae bacterium]|nr:GldG family protein [Spirochaetaceae bacterium]